MLSLAAGVLPGFGPDEIVRAAAAAGFEAAGIWFDADDWTDATTRRVAAALDDTGAVALDMEPVFVTPDGDYGDRLIDAAAELRVRNVLTVGRGVEVGAFTERLAELCRRAAPAGISVCVEFGRIFAIADLQTALAVAAGTGEANAGVLVDNLHLARAGHEPSEIAAAPAAAFPYAQLCDAPAEPPATDPKTLYKEAIDGRQNLGEGALPVLEVFHALPEGTPISLEVRSRALREDCPDPVDRARSVLDAAREVLVV